MADTQKDSQPVGQSKSNEAQVTFSNEVPDPFVPGENQDNELTTCYKVRCRWVLDDRILAAPVCGRPKEGNGFEFVRVHRPTAVLAVEWTASRKGARPQIPKPYMINRPNMVLIKQEYDLDHVDIEGDDKALLSASGTFYYSARDRNQITLSYPKPPYIDVDDGADVAYVLEDTDFEPNITDFGWDSNRMRDAVTRP